LDDLDEDKMHEFILLARAKRNFPLPEKSSPEKLLTHLSLMDDKGRISNSAVLLFGKLSMSCVIRGYVVRVVIQVNGIL
jgi:predicted HTH transcriptional regulator